MADKLDDLLKHANALVYGECRSGLRRFRAFRPNSKIRRRSRAASGEAAIAAATKLRIGFGLDPSSGLGITDRRLTAFPLVGPDTAADVLIAQAQRSGPCVHELEMQVDSCKGPYAHDWKRGFYALPGRAPPTTNRGGGTPCQAEAACQEQRTKLASSVEEARKDMLSARDQLESGLNKLSRATIAYESTRNRLMAASDANDRSPAQVMSAIQTLQEVNLSYVAAMSDFDKAQLRLVILTGGLGGSPDH